jgi:zinc transport system substrate-binding protein
MRKLAALALAAVFALSMTSCQNSVSGNFVIVTSTYPIYCMTLNIVSGANQVTIKSLSNITAGCAHDYQLTSADRRSLADANIVIINGAGLEPYLDAVLPSLKSLGYSSDGIELIPSSDEHDSSGLNPHTWVSIPNAIIQLRNIKDALADANPKNAAIYEKNFSDYSAKLQEKYEQMQTALAPYAGTKIVTFHPAFDYFALDFGFAVEGSLVIEPETPPTANELRELILIIEERGVKAMFVELGDVPDSAAVVARDTGIPVYTLDPAVIPVEDVADTDRYLYAMEYNLETLVSAFSGD